MSTFEAVRRKKPGQVQEMSPTIRATYEPSSFRRDVTMNPVLGDLKIEDIVGGPIVPERRIIVVEDAWPLSRLTTFVLGSEGYKQIRNATSAEQALKLMEEEDPEIIITDLEMKGMGGLGLVNEVNSRYTGKRKPLVIVASAGLSHEKQLLLFSKGVLACVIKPCDVDSILNIVQVASGMIDITLSP